jgi:hypothetical protein
MASEREHVSRAKHDELLARTLGPSFEDWRIIATFYAALHYVEAIIVRNGGKSASHRNRKAVMNSIPLLQQVVTDYDTLRNQAEIARYRPDIDFSSPSFRNQVTAICSLLGSIKSVLGFQDPPIVRAWSSFVHWIQTWTHFPRP